LFLLDTITQNSKGIPLAKTRVKLSNLNDSLNFIYSVDTDNEGYFNFTLLGENENQLILSVDTIMKSISYRSKTLVKKGDDNISLILQLDETSQNGFHFYTKDNLGNVIPKCDISIYNNEALALLDNKLGAFATIESDENGKLFKISLPKGKYYMNASKVIGNVTFKKIALEINVPEYGFIRGNIILERQMFIPQNGFNLTVQDSIGGIIPLARVFLYNSQVLATANSANGLFGNFITDSVGKLSRYDLPSGDYFLNVSKVISDTLIYESLLNKITLPASGIISQTVVLRRKR
jgi:hypothetical protein